MSSTRKWTGVLALILICALAVYRFYPERELPGQTVIDRIVVNKSERRMDVYSRGKLVKSYKVSLGRQPSGKKEYEGDRKTPEGIYKIDDRNLRSGYHKNLGISYPGNEDLRRAEELGKRPGGGIKIHGLRNHFGFIGKFHRFFDWTMGCIAVTNREIDELYRSVETGAIIEIRP